MKHRLRKLGLGRIKSPRAAPDQPPPPGQYASVFDPVFYCQENPDVVAAGLDPLAHFHAYGLGENRRPSAWFSETYVRNSLHQQSLSDQTALEAYVASDMSRKPRLIFVSHEASRTGAPAIILRLLEIFSTSGAFECFSILDTGGERLVEFEALSHTHVMSAPWKSAEYSDAAAFQELSSLLHPGGIFASNPPLSALVNSASSHCVGQHLATLNIPVVSLIHEIAAYYDQSVFEGIYAFSDKMVFPSDFVSKAAHQHCDIDTPKTLVRGQGLLEDDFGTLDRDHCRRLLREELGIEDDAFVILNVGTLDMRKGVDLFVDLAKLFADRGHQSRPVYFVWYGAEHPHFTYARDFVARHGLGGQVRIMPPTAEIEQVFLGGDLFLLTARADPFPCVIHEAMACGLPVIAFRDGGGAPELVGQDSGTIIDMANLPKLADVIQRYLDDPDLHAQHAQNAMQKIRRDWSYHSYQQDIYALLRDSAKDQKRNWPVMTRPAPPDHLVVMQGGPQDMAALTALHHEPESGALTVALIDGRFRSDIDATITQLRALGLPYRVHQPAQDTVEAREDILAQVLRKPRPRRVTLINTLRYVSANLLKPLPYPKTAICTGETLKAHALYLCMPYLDRLDLSDSALRVRLITMNPSAQGRVRHIAPHPPRQT